MFRLALLLLLAVMPSYALSWVPGSALTVYYTPGTSLGVLYIVTDTSYLTGITTVEHISGSEPSGISWAKFGSCSSGKLCTAFTGTPSGTATTVVVLRANDGTSTADITVTFQPTFAISGTVNATAVVNASYSSSALATVGGVSPVTWSLFAGSLPPGLSLDSTSGAITGTPTTTGTYVFTVRAVDSTPLTATSLQTINVYAALSVTTNTLSATTVGATYNQTLASSGGTTPKTWSIASGSLPAGLSLNASTGAITGTASAAGTASFTAQVACCTTATGSGALSILVNPAPSISTTTLPGGPMNVAYSQQLSGSGGTGGLTWTLFSGALPAGLTLSTGGLISGTPTASGTANFTVRAQDTLAVYAQQSLSITVSDQPSITTSSFAAATVGGAVNTSLASTGGTSPYSYQVLSGSLPTGVTLNPSGTLSGTPAASGTFDFTIQVTDSASSTGTRALSWTVNPAPSVSPSTMSAATVGGAYTATFSATGGTGSITFSAIGLPAGLNISTGGVVSGTPTASGAFNVTITAQDSNGVQGNVNISFTVNPAPSISTTSLPNGLLNGAYSQQLVGSGGTGSLSWTLLAGSLPAGLTLSTGGLIGGTAAASGTANFTVKAQDTYGIFAQQVLSITIADPPSITTSSFAPATVGGAVNTALAATSGQSPYTYQVLSGSLPTGIVLNSNGTLSGTPSASGVFNFTIQVADAVSATGTRALTWTVNPAPSVSPSSMNPATIGGAYTVTFSATGGTGSITFSAVGLPSGLTISTGGVVSGTPTASGVFNVTVTARDANNADGVANISFTVNAAPSITTTTLPDGAIGTAYSQTISTNGGTGPFVWSIPTVSTGGSGPFTLSVSAGALPSGVTLAGGVLSGTPSVGGAFSFTVQITDANGVTATRGLTMNVLLSVTITTLPAGMRVLLDGQNIATPATYQWVPGVQHTLAALAMEPGPSRYRLTGWSDNGAASHTVAPTTSVTYTATFTLEHKLTTTVTPVNAGAVDTNPGSADGFFASGTLVQVHLIPNEGYNFVSWTGSAQGNVNPILVLMDAPKQLASDLRTACNFTLQRVATSVMPSGDLGRVVLTTGRNCPWTATSDSNWITILSGNAGTTSGVVRYLVAPNPSNLPRSGALTIAGINYPVHQSGTGCTFVLNPASQQTGTTAASFAFQVSTPAACQWTPVGTSTFINVTGDRVARQGSGEVPYWVQNNTQTPPRVGLIEAGGQTFSVLQQGNLTQPLFTDVGLTSVYGPYISIAALAGAMPGCDGSRFCPETLVTRADAAEYIIRALYGETFSFPSVPYFTDVTAQHPQFRFIQKFRELGVTKGCSPTQYCPGATTNRGEMAVFLMRAKLGIMENDAFPYTNVSYFDDVRPENGFYTFIQKMRESGITQGCSGTQYCPLDKITRGQMAVFLSRSLLAR
ncbi:MAG: BACON domain-containing protein [Acidobacteria bacterium]|nr:BACON domain-containing protein [Acidobacteriota bacterium]